MYFYVYILLSEKDKMFYTGYTSNLEERIVLHNKGQVKSTKNRIPLKLIYFEKFEIPFLSHDSYSEIPTKLMVG